MPETKVSEADLARYCAGEVACLDSVTPRKLLEQIQDEALDLRAEVKEMHRKFKQDD